MRTWSAGLRRGVLAGALAVIAFAMTPITASWAAFSDFSPSSPDAHGENGWSLGPGTITYTVDHSLRTQDYTKYDVLGLPVARVYVTERDDMGACLVDGQPVPTSPTHAAGRSDWVIPVPTDPGAGDAGSGTYDVDCSYVTTRLEVTVWFSSIPDDEQTTQTEVHEHATVKIDTTPPSVSAAARAPASRDPQGTLWHRTPTLVDFAGTDEESGVTSCSAPVAIGGPSGAGDKTAVGSCRNGAGAVGEVSYVYRFDDEVPESAATVPPSHNGWYTSDTEVTWNWSDRLSGVKAQACPASSIANGEGVAVKVAATCLDWAGNQASAELSVAIDTTDPVITAAVTPEPNGAGWHNHDVVFEWRCADELSGPEAETTSQTVSTEGADVSVTGVCTDVAGNVARDTQSGIKLDKTPPVAAPLVSGEAGSAGWYLSPVSVLWRWSDALSEVDDDVCDKVGATQREGAGQTLDARCADVAENVGTASRTFDVDLTDPEIVATVDPDPGASGWHTAPVAIRYECDDPGTGSGVAACPQDVTVDDAGETTVTRSVTDRAGREGAVSTTVKVDLEDPVITATPDRPADVNGWYTAPVTVRFTCSDPTPGSGIAECPAPVVVSDEGQRRVVGHARDRAGRRSTDAAVDVRVDLQPPNATITRRGLALELGAGGLQLRETLGGTATDAMSGVRQVAVRWTSSLRGTETVIADLACTDATRRVCTWSAKVPLLQARNAVVVATDRAGRDDPTPESLG